VITMVDFGLNQVEISWPQTLVAGAPSQADIIKIVQGIAAVGADRVRIAAAWDFISPAGQPYTNLAATGQWGALDNAVNLSVQNGLKPLLCINYGYGAGGDGSTAAYAAVCGAIAARYGPAGTNQVAVYELFNEPNYIQNFNPPIGWSPASFVQYLKAGYSAIKAVHSSSTVIAGGTIPAPSITFSGVDPVTWYTGIYAANGGSSAGLFDAAGFHWYGTDAGVAPTPSEYHWGFLTNLRALMVTNGDTAKKIWITEMGIEYPGDAPSLTLAAAWLQIMVNFILSQGYFGPFLVYNFRGVTSDTVQSDNDLGLVDFNYDPRQPYYAYVATLNTTVTPTTPTTPAGLTVTDVTYFSATFTCNTSMDPTVVGYRVYVDGVLSAEPSLPSATVDGLNFGTPYTAYMTAVNATGIESAASSTVSFTTNASPGLQASFSYTFSGSTLPPVFNQLGLGFAVASSAALPHSSTTDGEFWTVSPYNLGCQSADHYSQISQSIASAYEDRAALALVRMAPDGSQWVAAAIYGSGQADACQIITYYSGVITVQYAVDASPLLPGEDLICTAQGNAYTATHVDVKNNSTVLLTWTDINGVYPGAANRIAGIGWHHKRVGAVNYPAPGITGLWQAADVAAVNPSGGGAGGGAGAGSSNLWKLAIAKPSQFGLVFATDLWQTAL
jgi:polysaccharide biosynthesis protein PslG